MFVGEHSPNNLLKVAHFNGVDLCDVCQKCEFYKRYDRNFAQTFSAYVFLSMMCLV